MTKWFSLALTLWFAFCVSYWFGLGQTLMGILLLACGSVTIFTFFLASAGYDLTGRIIAGLTGNVAIFTTSLVTHSSGYLVFNNILAVLFAFLVFSNRYERPYFLAFVTAPVLSALFVLFFGDGQLVPLVVDQETASKFAAPITLISIFIGSIASLYAFFGLMEAREMEMISDVERATVKEKSRTAFLANVTHEIRTPISSVLGLAGMLQENDTDPSRQRLARNIADVSNSILTIVNDLLDSAKMDSGKLEVHMRSESVLEILEGVFSTIRLSAHADNVAVFLDYDCTLPKVLDTDAIRLRQILLNLLSNAIKFSKKSATGRDGEVHVLVTRTAKDQLCFEVSDNGIGMSEEHLSHMFQPFAQADHTITERFGGTGLGLSITKALVEAMKGSIRVASSLGRGSQFSVSLPIRNPVYHVEDLDGSHGFCVIYCEKAQFCTLLQRYAAHIGANVVIAESPNHLAELVSELNTQLIVSDIRETDVRSHMVRLLEENPSLQIIGVSSDPTTELPKGFKDIVYETPLVPSELWAAMRSPQNAKDVSQSQSDLKRVLVLEDDRVNRSVLVHQVQSLGGLADGAESGSEALKLLSYRSYDLILCDYSLPDTNGPEFAMKVHRLFEEKPDAVPRMFAVTGRKPEEIAQQCFDAGFSGFETKPVSLENLSKILKGSSKSFAGFKKN